ncbi:hypothetical protein HYV30_04070 [Candidatus Kaiserbacteria bacterium]|nr:hypothetical protein [Candidatus Kaiserbacteria bacterium]
MDPELKKVLEETHALARDNHRMLRAIRRSQVVSLVSTIVVWVAVLALPLYFYQQYLAPTIEQISELSGVPATTTRGLFGLPTSEDLQKLLNSFRAK